MERLLEHVPEKLHDVFTAILELTDEFCEEHLDEHYQQLANDMAMEICQKNSYINIKQGRPKSWASGIIHALGCVNFLQDPDTEPYMSSAELAKGFGVSQGTMTAKSKVIRDVLGLIPFDPDWCLPDMLDDNPFIWMVEVNGLILDMRKAPREFQETAYMNGLIPFIPDDKKEPVLEIEAEGKVIKFPGTQNKKTSKPKSTECRNDNEPMLF